MSHEPFEYLESNPATWRVREAPPLPDWVNDRLVSIAGRHSSGKPNLRCTWGGTAKNESAAFDCLKYSCGFSRQEVAGYEYTKDGETFFTETIEGIDPAIFLIPTIRQPEELGLLRWVIEKLTPPEELERMGRFQKRYADGEIVPTLREFPKEGIYECFFIIETKAGKYHDLDADVMLRVKQMWDFSQLPFAQQETLELEAEAKSMAKKASANKEIWDNVQDMKMPDEEKWARENNESEQIINYEKSVERAKTLTFYNPQENLCKQP